MALARALDAPLHVLRVLPGLTRLQTLFSRRSVLTAARAVERTLRANRATRSWLRVTLGSDEAVEHIAITHGEFVEQAAAYAATVDAALIIVPPRHGRLGKTVEALACAAQRPVLVARDRRGKPAILAATDLRSEGHPVLKKAGELAQRLDARLVALHNVDPAPLTSVATAWTGSAAPSAVVRGARQSLLAAALENLPPTTEAVLLDEPSLARAILAEAQARDTDWVAVGTRRRTWFDELAAASVAASVVERAQRSVLVVPLDTARPASPIPCGPKASPSLRLVDQAARRPLVPLRAASAPAATSCPPAAPGEPQA